jgi:predicted AAA+ superfamily ATPase
MSFEDPRLVGFEVNDFFKLENIFQNNNSTQIYFFDEIQNVEGWEQFVRTLHDKKTKTIITGSNASLLSLELGSSLTGRQITYELFPFSYDEFLSFINVKLGIDSFTDYLTLGGFPEYLSSQKPDILTQLFNDLIYRDIVVRHSIRNAKAIMDLGIYLASNIGKEFSYNKLTNIFELGSVNTVRSYISYFQDAYLFFTVPRFSYSLKQQSKNQKKIYGIDTGLMSNLSLSFSADKGRMLENIVFIELKRREKDIFYFRNKKECDFVVSKNKRIESIIQVCYQLNQDNLQRELAGLKEAMNELNMSHGLILTMNQHDLITENNKTIIVKPVWEWISDKG